MWHGLWSVFICVAAVPCLVEAFPSFQDKLPNGRRVPNPCDDTARWEGVGHEKSGGGGTRNPFGADFEQNGKKWSVKLCEMDSDGDGMTNGQELGDPNCTWTTGATPYRTNDLAHPGICEPITTEHCKKKNHWLKCEPIKKCDAFEDKDMKNVTLKFPVSNIPAQVTTYYCQIFDLPSDGDFHLVATRPLIDNKEFTHHMLLFGCDERAGRIQSTPKAQQCGMMAHPQCILIIGTWTIGSQGDCLHTDMGFKIGLRGFRKAALQIHWNNPSKIGGQSDSSGMVLYYTKQLRQFNAGMLAVGQTYLQIPPRQPEVSFSSTCSSECTKVMFPVPVYITRAANHMHNLGIAQKVTLYRNGTKIRDLTNDKPFQYDKPVFHKYDPPVEVLPGDEIKTTCVYSSLTKDRTVYFGNGTFDEMCFGFLTYYPLQPIRVPYCTTWKTVEKCKRYLPEFKGIVHNCNWVQFLSPKNVNTRRILTEVHSACSNKSHADHCTDRCIEVLKRARTENCLKGDLGDFLLFKLSTQYPEIVRYFSQCITTSGAQRLSTNIVSLPRLYIIVIIFIRFWMNS